MNSEGPVAIELDQAWKEQRALQKILESNGHDSNEI